MPWKPFRPPSFETDSVPVKQSLASLAKRLGAASPDAMTVVFEQWSETVGDELASHTLPVSLADGVLVVHVDDPMWLSQMKWMTGNIVQAINAKVGSDVVERVEVRAKRR